MSVYNFTVKKSMNQPVSLSEYQGKVLLIVNTASKCAFTPQFDDLQKLYQGYAESGFEIIGFPCNQFGEQEPGTDEDAATFCQLNYGVKFPIFSKIEVNGDNEESLFSYLKKVAPFKGFDDTNSSAKLLKMMITEKNPEWLIGNEIKWNFTKFLVSEKGIVLKRYEPYVGVDEVKADVSRLLKYKVK